MGMKIDYFISVRDIREYFGIFLGVLLHFIRMHRDISPADSGWRHNLSFGRSTCPRITRTRTHSREPSQHGKGLLTVLLLVRSKPPIPWAAAASCAPQLHDVTADTWQATRLAGWLAHRSFCSRGCAQTRAAGTTSTTSTALHKP